jgi:hypothetical protein
MKTKRPNSVQVQLSKKPNSVTVQLTNNPREGKSENFTVYDTTPKELKKLLIKLLENVT